MQEPAPGRPIGQEARIDGQNNIVVQIVGDGNTVVSGYAHLTLTRYLTRRRIEGDADRLSPYTRSIPLIGRVQEMADLRAWLNGDKPISVRVLTGRAGSGKTRLALELCEALLKDGWDAGFVDSGELVRFRNQQNLSTWGWRKPTLAVIDYVAAQAELLSGWLQELADNPGDPAKPLRLLLLERQAETGSGWWQTAFGCGGWGARTVRKLLDPAEPVPLAPLAAASERRDVLRQVMREKGAAVRPPEEGTDPAFDCKLSAVPWGGEPLFLMMAGVLAADRGVGEVLALRRTDLAFELAERELDRVGRFAGADNNRRAVLCHLAAYATLCRGLSREAAEAAAEVEKQELKRPASGDPAELVDLLQQALPGPSQIEPILPDMIGEAAILRAFEPLRERSAPVVCRAFAQAGQPVAATVVRTAQDFAGDGHNAPLAWFDALVERDEVGLEQLILLADALPGTSLALSKRAARLARMVVERLRDAVVGEEAHRLPVLAVALSNLGERLSAVGQREDALAPAKEAVEIYRMLPAEALSAFRPAFAASLDILASCLSEVGRCRDALAPVTEAVEIRRTLAEEVPDAWRPALAGSLNNLAKTLSEVGRHEDALASAQEAVEIYRALAEEAPDAYRPDLAMSLTNLAACFSAVERRQDALARAQEAVEIRRTLAEEVPDAWRPALAGSLNNLAKTLSEVGRHEDALARAQEAVEIYRALAEGAPDAYRPDLAMSLTNLAACFSAVERCRDALAPVTEAVKIYRALAEEAPDAYRPALAVSLNNLAAVLNDLGRHQDALSHAQKAVEIRRTLAEGAPDAYRPDLAVSLKNLAICLSEVGRHGDALAPAKEAVETLAPHFFALPNAFALSIATTAQIYLARCKEVGQEPDKELLSQILAKFHAIEAEHGDGNKEEGEP